MGGRIDDIAVSESDPSVIYVGYAVGGVFKSDNNGTTFTPVFETYGTASIGDIAIHPTNPNIVYVGTGEPNNRQTSSFGDGIYKTTDGGKTFTNVGLKDTQTIARIVIDPKNPDTVYVASPGHLFGPNPDRGVFKTTDGGKTWNKIKFIDDDTGFTDIAIDPVEHQHPVCRELSAASQRLLLQRRRAGQRLWKTIDAGKTWTKLTGSGLPSGTYGRIALDVSRSNPNVVYAQIEAGEVGRARPCARRGSERGHRSDTSWRRCGDAARRVRRRRARGAAAPAAARWRRRPRRIQLVQQRGPGRGLRPRRRAGRYAARAGGRERRRVPIGQQGEVVDARQQLQLAADVFQPASRRSRQRQGDLRRRPARGEVARRRKDVRDARRGRRPRRARPRRSTRHLDRSAATRST